MQTRVVGSLVKMVIAVGSDLTGLGRQNWIQVRRNPCSTFIIIIYQSIKSRTAVRTAYIQRERYFKQRNILDCARKLFINHLVQFAIQLRSEGHKVILAADTNENSIVGKL